MDIPVLSGATLSAARSVNGTGGYGFFVGELATAGCPSGPVMIEADYFQVGLFTITLYQGDNVWGTGTLSQDESISVISYTMGYIGGRASAGFPVQVGPWVTISMRNFTPGTFIGNIYFTTTSLTPPAGTWEIKDGSVRAAGTWESSVPFP